jgi:hypothetical protein
MSKDVAVISDSGEVVAINVHMDDYELAPNELLVTGPAWVGGTFDSGYFYPPQPYPSWVKDEGVWAAPVSMPDDGGRYQWSEELGDWVALSD